MKKLNSALNDRHNRLRKGTCEKVQIAIDEIKADGGEVTKSLLIEITGLCSATFSKEHVKDLLKKNQVCQFVNNKVVKREANYVETLVKMDEDNVLLINKQKSRIQDLEIIIKRREDTIEANKEIITELKEKNAMLLGKLHLILAEIDMRGYEKINTGFDIL